MKPVTFMSDFGLADHYVAAVKASIIGLNTDIQLIDISHQIEKYNTIHAAFVFSSVFKDFPDGTIHLIAVDSEKNDYLIIFHNKQWLILPDNGLFGLITHEQPDKIWRLSTDDTSITFPEKKIFGKVVHCILSDNENFEGINAKEIDYEGIDKLFLPEIRISDSNLFGTVVHIDDYGNCITNINKDAFENAKSERKFQIRILRDYFSEIAKGYKDVYEGDCVILFNEQNLLEIAINKGNASELLGLKYDSPVIVYFEG